MGTIARRGVAAGTVAALATALLAGPASAAYRMAGSPAYTPPRAEPFVSAAPTIQPSGWAIL